VLVLAALLLVVVRAGWLSGPAAPPPPPGCTATAGAGRVGLTVEQAVNATTIAVVGRGLGLPDHAVTIALATALQESGLRDIAYGDRDSLGLFQQRPSQGWGTPAQLMDTTYATRAFYRRLAQVSGWRQLSVTAAAQQVQRSAAPDAYADWEDQARTLARALTGEVAAGLTCHDLALSAVPGPRLEQAASKEVGTAALSGPHPLAAGWADASWLVGHAAALGVDSVSFAGRTWTASSGRWTTTGPTTGTSRPVLSLHRAAG
jgi:hypothetical protein